MAKEGFRRAVVVGTGLMGPGIAFTLASAGCEVILHGLNQELMEEGMNAVAAAAATLREGGCLTAAESDDILRRVHGTIDLEAAVATADLITESIIEDKKTKQDLFLRVERSCPPHAVLTSNTSGLPATLLASVLTRPKNFAVTHFWNPPHIIPLVEVIKGEKTSEDTIESLLGLLRKAGKKPVVVRKDTPGQLGNRLLHALIREAYWIVQEGIASPEDVDTAIKYGLGRRFPVYSLLEHLDIIGLDMVLAIQSYMCRALCNETEPARVLREKVASGELGLKTDRGFFDWRQRNAKTLLNKRDSFLIEMLRAEAAEPPGQ
jgi:3-hydroxybutyryl-CoA dehydrogenase